jgi:PEP-CTERM motif
VKDAMMKAALALVSLGFAAVPSAHARASFHSAYFDVVNLDFNDSYLEGSNFVWQDDAYARAFNTPSLGSVGRALGSTGLTWSAAAGYEITGFIVTYDFSFSGAGSYLVRGGEYGADFGGVKAGDTWLASGLFNASYADGSSTAASFSGPGSLNKSVTTRVSGAQFNTDFNLSARGLQEFCVAGYSIDQCLADSPGARYGASTRLSLNSISITPQVVSVVPEPSVAALMLAGLGLVGLSARRFR